MNKIGCKYKCYYLTQTFILSKNSLIGNVLLNDFSDDGLVASPY